MVRLGWRLADAILGVFGLQLVREQDVVETIRDGWIYREKVGSPYWRTVRRGPH